MLQRINDNLWTADQTIKMNPGFYMPIRMTVVRLPNQELILHSPIPVNDTLAMSLNRLGEVKHLIAPNCMHHLSLKGWAERCPDARRYAAMGLEGKRPDLTFHETLWESPPSAWRDTLEQVCIQGAPSLNEVVFFHRPSRTLIVTDLVFNIHQTKGALTPWVLRTTGTYQKPAVSRIWRLATKDRKKVRASVGRVLEWDIQRIIPAHGDVLETDAKATLKRILRWMLEE